MHKFLRAIGFSDITKKDLEMILDEVITRPEIMKITKDDLKKISNEVYDEVTKQNGEDDSPIASAVADVAINVVQKYFEKVIEIEK